MSGIEAPTGPQIQTLRTVQQLVEEVRIFKNQQIALYTTTNDTSVVTDADGNPVTLPAYHTLGSSSTGSGGGVATTAQKLATPRIINVAGIISGAAAFDGSTDITINTFINPNTLPQSAVVGLVADLSTMESQVAAAVTASTGALAAVQSLQTQVNGKLHGFVYDQVTASTMWTVVHGLNKRPAVSVVDTAGTVMTCSVQYFDDNTVLIQSTAPIAGQAYFN
jgi:hypothetical protein